MSPRRGPYRRHTPLKVVDPEWNEGDTLTVGRTRWLVKTIDDARNVLLHSSSTVNHLVKWNTTLDQLPEKSPA
ncbi:MAG: hypothetical protein PIR02_16070 [Microbacterium enclense]